MKNLNKKGLLIIISGPSGVGKGTIREKLMLKEGINLFYSVSMTSRNQRPAEVNGREYYFVSREEFEKNIKNGNLLEWTEYCGNYYGTPLSAVEKMRNEGKNVLMEIDVNGAKNVIEKVPDIISIFIAPPSFDELANRLKHRGTESEDVINTRIERARKELNFKNQYKYVVINNDLEFATNEVAEIILKESK